MIKIDENDPVGEIEPSFPYRDVVIKRDTNVKQFYDLQDEIGRGKFGTVYRCQEKSTGLKLAAKFVNIAKRQDRRNAEREVEIMKELQHPRLIQIYDAYEANNVMCVILELIEGGELFERVIDDDFILTEKSVAVFMRQICEGIEFIHSKNVIHLDMKPENILCLTRTGNRIKIIDFGLARKYDPEKKLQVLFGTPEFVAPEVVNFDSIGFGTDMWSVGVICYVLLSGLSPFMGETDVQTMANVTLAQYDFDDEAFNDISEDAKDFIRKLLLKRRQDRMSASECLAHRWLLRKTTKPTSTNVVTSTSSTSVDGQFVTSSPVLSNELDYSKNDLRNLVNRWNDDVPTVPCLVNGEKRDEIDSLSAGKSIKADEIRPASNACIDENVAATSSGKTIRQPTATTTTVTTTTTTTTSTTNNNEAAKNPNAPSIPVVTERERGIIELTDNDRNVHASVANSDTALINNIDCNNNNKERLVKVDPNVDSGESRRSDNVAEKKDGTATSSNGERSDKNSNRQSEKRDEVAAVNVAASDRRITENGNVKLNGDNNIRSAGGADKCKMESAEPTDDNIITDIGETESERIAGNDALTNVFDRNELNGKAKSDASNATRQELKSDWKDGAIVEMEEKPLVNAVIGNGTASTTRANEVSAGKQNEIEAKLTGFELSAAETKTMRANSGMRTVENETRSKGIRVDKNEMKTERVNVTENEAKRARELNNNGTRSDGKSANDKNELKCRLTSVNKVSGAEPEPVQQRAGKVDVAAGGTKSERANVETSSERKVVNDGTDRSANENGEVAMKSALDGHGSDATNATAGPTEKERVAQPERTEQKRLKTTSVTKKSKLFDKIDMFEQSGRRHLNDLHRHGLKSPPSKINRAVEINRTATRNAEISSRNESTNLTKVADAVIRRSDNDNVEFGQKLAGAGRSVSGATMEIELKTASAVSRDNADDEKSTRRASTSRSNSEHRVVVVVVADEKEEDRVPVNGELRTANENDTVGGRAGIGAATRSDANVTEGGPDDGGRTRAKCGLVTVIDDQYEVKRKKSLIIKNISEVTETPKLVITHKINVEREEDDRAGKFEKSPLSERHAVGADRRRKVEMRKVRSIDEALIELTKAALEFRGSFDSDFAPTLAAVADRRISDVGAHLLANGRAGPEAAGPPRSADWFTREIKKFSEKVMDSSSSSSSSASSSSSSDRKQHEMAAGGSAWGGTRRPKFKLTCLNRDVPFGGPNLNYYRNLFSRLPGLDRSMGHKSTLSKGASAPLFHSEPGSPRLSPEKNNCLTREILSRLLDDRPTTAEGMMKFVFSPAAAYRTEQDG